MQISSMSSTSSSECMCNDCFNYAAALKSPSYRTRAPYYQNLGHPLIYYARVQRSPNFQPRNKESKKGPNCFVKAFRWYTQDHPPQSPEPPGDRTDLAGFAVWLDKKYDEFIMEKQGEKASFLHPKQAFELQPQETQVHVVLDPLQKEKINKIRSPKKRQRAMQFGANTPERCDQSFEYILRPKDLSRPASECCRQILSNDTGASKKTLLQMRGHSSERTVSGKTESMPIEIIKIDRNKCTEEVSNIKRPEVKEIDNKKPEVKKASSIKPVKNESLKSVKDVSRIKSANDVLCQCPEEKLVKVNTSTQSEVKEKSRTVTETVNYYCCPACATRNDDNISAPSQKINEVPDLQQSEIVTKKNDDKDKLRSVSNLCICSEDLTFVEMKNYHSRFVPEGCDCDCSCTNEDELVIASQTVNNQIQPKDNVEPVIKEKDASVKTYSTSAAQTSDHAISFDTGGYPLFMKIVYADKLNEEITCK